MLSGSYAVTLDVSLTVRSRRRPGPCWRLAAVWQSEAGSRADSVYDRLGRYTVAVKVIDPLGNYAMPLVSAIVG